MSLRKVGTLVLGEEVDITDPCYDRDVWCRMTETCEPGEYTGYVNVMDCLEWGMRETFIAIYKGDRGLVDEPTEYLGDIGVDAGLAGFFNNKPDFSGEEWSELCLKISDIGEKGVSGYCMYNGIFCDSGYGDGVYAVFTNADRTAFRIDFID